MEILLNVLLKLADYLIKRTPKEGDPKREFCQNLTKVYLLLEEFTHTLGTLLVLLESRVEPHLRFYEREKVKIGTKGFGRGDIKTLEAHLLSSDREIVKETVYHYRRLNRTRDQIFDIVASDIPLAKVDILYPDVSESLAVVIMADNPTPVEEGDLVKDASWRPNSKLIQELDQETASFHIPLILAVNTKDGTKWKEYLRKLEQDRRNLADVQTRLRDFIRTNCTLSDVL